MDNIKIVEVETINGELVKHVIIDRANGEFTSMPKAVWDEMQAQLEPAPKPAKKAPAQDDEALA